jgi:hypothetical protein
MLVLAWATADAFLFEHRVRTMIHLVRDVPLGTTVDQVQGMAREYEFAFDSDGTENIGLHVYPTALEFQDRRAGIRIMPRNLVLKRAGAGGEFVLQNHRVVGRSVGIGTSPDKDGIFSDLAWIEEPGAKSPVDRHTVDWKVTHEGFDFLKWGRTYSVIIHADSTKQQRMTAYEVDFHCLWRWNTCDPGANLLVAGRQPH